MDHKSNEQVTGQTASYGTISRLLHWGMATLIFLVLVTIELKDFFPKGPVRHEVVDWHFQMGFCVLLLIFMRIAWRVRNPPPPIFPPLSGMQARASAIAHFVLYALMLMMPILGVLARQSKGHDVDFLGYVLPTFLNEDSGLGHTIKIFHAYLGNVLIALVALHVFFAVYHHVIQRDDTLMRMLK